MLIILVCGHWKPGMLRGNAVRMLRSDPAGRDHGGVMAARTARLYDAVHDQLLERADSDHRAVEEGQRGAQVAGDDAEDGGGQHADSGRIAIDVDAGTCGTCEWTDTADDRISAILGEGRGGEIFLDHVITIIFCLFFVISLVFLSACACLPFASPALYVYAFSRSQRQEITTPLRTHTHVRILCPIDLLGKRHFSFPSVISPRYSVKKTWNGLRVNTPEKRKRDLFYVSI